MLVSEIAEQLGYDVCGNGQIEIERIAYAGEAKSGELAVALRRSDIMRTEAEAVLTAPCLMHTDKTLIYTYEKIDVALAKLAGLFIRMDLYPDYTEPVHYHKTSGCYYCGKDVFIGDGTVICPEVFVGNDVKIGHGCHIGSHVTIGSGTRLGNDVVIEPGARIGADSFYHSYEKGFHPFCGIGKVIINDGVHIGYNTIVQRGTLSDTVIDRGTVIGNLVDIGHDVHIGRNCKIVSMVALAGNVHVGDHVMIFGQSGVANDVHIHDYAVIKGKTLVTKDVSEKEVIFGPYGRRFSEELKIQAKIKHFFRRKEG